MHFRNQPISIRTLLCAIFLFAGSPAMAADLPEPALAETFAPSYAIELQGGLWIPIGWGSGPSPLGNLRLSYAATPELEFAAQGGVMSFNQAVSTSPANTLTGYLALDARYYLSGRQSAWQPFLSASAGLLTLAGGPLPLLPFIGVGGGTLWHLTEQLSLSGSLDLLLNAVPMPRLGVRYTF